jgi:hypothetical protein
MSETFQQRYCRHFKVAPERYAGSLLRRVLYPRVHLLRPLLWLRDHDHFAADHQFVIDVGRLTQRREFHTELKDFQYHPDNRGFLRGFLRLRISANRMSKVFYEVWAADPSAAADAPTPSGAPFSEENPGRDPSAPKSV